MDNVIIDDLRTNNTIDVSAVTGIGGRDYQQDCAYMIVNDNSLYVTLCDGMGGMEAGKEASRTCLDVMNDYFAAYAFPADQAYNPVWMLQAIEYADDVVYHMSDSEGRRLQCGTTLLSAVIYNGCLYWGSVGDSRAYFYRDSQMVRITHDHNYAAQLADQIQTGQITAQTYAKEIEKGEALISFIGMGGLNCLDISDTGVPLMKDDVILLCSDGVYKCLGDQAICNILSNAGSADQIAEEIHRDIVAHNYEDQDNYTAVIIRINSVNREEV